MKEGRMIRIYNHLRNKYEHITVMLTIVNGNQHDIHDVYNNVNNFKYENFKNIQKLGTIYPHFYIDVPYSKLIMDCFPNYMTVLQFHVRTIPISSRCEKTFMFNPTIFTTKTLSSSSSSSSLRKKKIQFNYYRHSLIEDEFKGCKEIKIFGHDGIIIIHSVVGSLYPGKPPRSKLIDYLKKKMEESSPDHKRINNFLKKLHHQNLYYLKKKVEGSSHELPKFVLQY
ncbi:hypothetical protein CsatA_000534 [Cannabis sativa]